MKVKMVFLLVLGIFVFVGANAHALSYGVNVGDQVKLTSYGPSVFGSNGGEFTMVSDQVPAYSWTSYCIEKNELIYQDSYDWVGGITDRAIAGGTNSDTNESGFDTLSLQSAWLYYSFVTDTLIGYDGSDTSQRDLQGLLWYYEDEVSGVTLSTGMNNWKTLADAAVAGGWLNNGKVMVLNLYESRTRNTDGSYTYTGNRQDLLIATVPDASIMFLLGPALLSLGLLGRRKKTV